MLRSWTVFCLMALLSAPPLRRTGRICAIPFHSNR